MSAALLEGPGSYDHDGGDEHAPPSRNAVIRRIAAEQRAEAEKLYQEAQTSTGRYTPNTFAWPIGSLVLHVWDAKEADCLLRVVSKAKPCDVTGAPQLRMQYEFPERLPVHFGGKSGKRYVVSTLDNLLDPARFGVVDPPQPGHVRVMLEGGDA